MKLFRTYIGGSKKNELQQFKLISDSDNIDWIEYSKLFNIFSEDIILTYKSRFLLSIILLHVSCILIIISILLLPKLIIPLIILSIILLYIKHFLGKKIRRLILLNDLTISIIKGEINKIYNF